MTVRCHSQHNHNQNLTDAGGKEEWEKQFSAGWIKSFVSSKSSQQTVIEPRDPEHLLAEAGLLICYSLTAFRDAEKGKLSGSTPVSSHLGHVSNGRVCVCDLHRLMCIAAYFIQHLHPVCNHCWVDWMQQHLCTPSTWSKSSEAKRAEISWVETTRGKLSRFKIPNSRSWRRAEASGVSSGQATQHLTYCCLYSCLYFCEWVATVKW